MIMSSSVLSPTVSFVFNVLDVRKSGVCLDSQLDMSAWLSTAGRGAYSHV